MSSPSDLPPGNIVSLRDVPKGALQRSAVLPESLRRAIETPLVAGYGRDDGAVDRGGGLNLVPGVWQAPERVTSEEAAAARLWMQAYDAGSPTVSDRDLRKWLMTFIGNLAVSSGSGEADIEMRVKLLAVAIDDRASKHFTKNSLKLAWERFKFIPTAQELMAFFDDLETRERTEAKRLMEVLDVAAKPPPPRMAPVNVEASMQRMRAKQAEENRQISEKLGVEPPRVSPRMLGETDREYGRRVALAAMRLCEEGQRALKGGKAKAKTPAEPETEDAT